MSVCVVFGMFVCVHTCASVAASAEAGGENVYPPSAHFLKKRSLTGLAKQATQQVPVIVLCPPFLSTGIIGLHSYA